MRMTRRGRGVVAAVVGLALVASVLAAPAVLATPVALAGLLLGAQYVFLRDLRATQAGLQVSQAVTPSHVQTADDATLTLTVEAETVVPLAVTVTPALPATLDADGDAGCRLDAERRVTTQTRVTPAVAGTTTIPRPRLAATDRLGLFAETLPVGDAVDLVAAPRSPREIHVGEGGDRIAAAYGEHPAGQSGAGLDPAELRKYLPGDPTNRIDWKATARLNEPHVREFDAETDRETTLVVDHRRSMAAGRDGETKLDYARELALAFVESARHLTDPLAYYAVGDAGLTDAVPAAATASQYRTITTRLHDLAPTAGDDRVQLQGPDTAGRAGRRLQHDDTRFGRTLAPYLTSADAYVERLDDRPLFDTIRRHHTRTTGRTWTVIVTDDSQPAEVRETVKLARQRGHVLVCLLPGVLYERGGLTDLDDAYARYREFESFRRTLARIEGVRALEVGPRDRLTTVLDQGRARRATEGSA